MYSKWTLCSKTCGLGTQTRTLKCLEQVAENEFRETDSCTDAKPTADTYRVCNQYPCPAKWNVGNWSEVGCYTKS